MALDMYLEVNGSQADWGVAKAILYEMGMSRLDEHRPHTLWGTLGNGEVFAEAQWGPVRSRNEILAEGMHGCSFAVTCDFSFRINNAMYDEAMATIKTFLTRLTERTDMLFVLSFQYEGVYAIRDRERGFEWFCRAAMKALSRRQRRVLRAAAGRPWPRDRWPPVRG
jgi:hypothetical protein